MNNQITKQMNRCNAYVKIEGKFKNQLDDLQVLFKKKRRVNFLMSISLIFLFFIFLRINVYKVPLIDRFISFIGIIILFGIAIGLSSTKRKMKNNIQEINIDAKMLIRNNNSQTLTKQESSH